MKNIKELLLKLKEITNVGDIGYHEITQERNLKPIEKVDSKLKKDDWQIKHTSHVININDNWILKQVLGTNDSVVIQDVDSLENIPEAFIMFNIKSIYVIPVNNTGIISIASIGEKHYFSQEEILKCKEIVNNF